MKNLVLTLVAAAVFALNTVNAQEPVRKLSNNENQNLITAIQSENTGLRKSGIYFAGKYMAKETAPVLIEQLEKETDPSVKVLIALALYKIGTEEGYESIQKLAKNDKNKEVRRMSIAILEQVKEDKMTSALSSR